MAEPSPKEIISSYKELSERLANLRRKRCKFVEEESRRKTSEREDFSDMFATTSIRKFGPDNPIHRDRGKERLLYQETGVQKPDGHIVYQDGDIAHLEAESSTLSKPERVLENLRRASEQGRE